MCLSYLSRQSKIEKFRRLDVGNANSDEMCGFGCVNRTIGVSKVDLYFQFSVTQYPSGAKRQLDHRGMGFFQLITLLPTGYCGFHL